MANDRREQLDDVGAFTRAAQKGFQAGLWTALPAIINTINTAEMTCTCQPSIQMRVQSEAGLFSWVTIKLLLDVPIVFPSAGGFSLTFPLRAGDEVLVVFSSRCIDSWWQSGGVQTQAELRMHDLSDGFAIPGPKSVPHALSPAFDLTKVQLRADDNSSHISIDQSGNVEVLAASAVTVTATTSVTINGPSGITLNGNVTVDGTITATGLVTAPDFATDTLPSYEAHTHLSRTDGDALTGPPIAGT